MADLRCNAKNCNYNKDSLCSKGDIMIGGQNATNDQGTCCDSFFAIREGRDSYTSSLSHPSHTISIDCEAQNCIYNHNYKCLAKKVQISGGHSDDHRDTACATFSEK